MKYTVLDMVQSLLGSMESDQVDSINDTSESYDLALMLRDLFYDISNDISLPEHVSLVELIASADAAKPCLMTVPAVVTSIDWIKYDSRKDGETVSNYKTIEYMPFPQFFDMTQGLAGNANVGTMNITMGSADDFVIYHENNRAPTFYTIVDDTTIVFDAFDNLVDSTLQKTKTMCNARSHPVFTISDAFVPDLNPQQFSYYLNRAKVRAFAEKKQVDHVEARGEARRQKVVGQKKNQIVSKGTPYDQLLHYGRMPRK